MWSGAGRGCALEMEKGQSGEPPNQVIESEGGGVAMIGNSNDWLEAQVAVLGSVCWMTAGPARWF